MSGLNYDAIESAFGKLDVEIATKPGKSWLGGKYLKVTAKVKAPAELEGYNELANKSAKLEITDEGFNTIKNTKKLEKLVLKTVSEAYAKRFLEMTVPDRAIDDQYIGSRAEELDSYDKQVLSVRIETSMESFADSLAKKLTETTGVTDVGPPSGRRLIWFADPEGNYVNRDKAPVYITAELVLNRKIRERREAQFLMEKTAKYAHEPQFGERFGEK